MYAYAKDAFQTTDTDVTDGPLSRMDFAELEASFRQDAGTPILADRHNPMFTGLDDRFQPDPVRFFL